MENLHAVQYRGTQPTSDWVMLTGSFRIQCPVVDGWTDWTPFEFKCDDVANGRSCVRCSHCNEVVRLEVRVDATV
jgi:hypothetical protein